MNWTTKLWKHSPKRNVWQMSSIRDPRETDRPWLRNSRTEGMLLFWVPTYGNCSNKLLSWKTIFASQDLQLINQKFPKKKGGIFQITWRLSCHSLQSLDTTTLLGGTLILGFLHFKQFDVQSKCRSRLQVNTTHKLIWSARNLIMTQNFNNNLNGKPATIGGTMSLILRTHSKKWTTDQATKQKAFYKRTLTIQSDSTEVRLHSPESHWGPFCRNQAREVQSQSAVQGLARVGY